MRVIFSKIDILSALNKIQSIVPMKPQMPILSNVLFLAVNNELILTATDLSLSMKITVPAKVIEEGAIVLSAKRLFLLIKELTSPDIEVATSPFHVAMIYSGSSQFKIPGMNPAEFPEVPNLSEGLQVPFPTAVLKEMLSKTSFSAGKDESRPIFSSIHLQRNSLGTTFTGADGKRVARSSTDLSFPPEWQGSFILPIKTVDEMIRLLDTQEETILLYFLEQKISMQAGPIVLVSGLLSGQYPDISRIIPEKQPSSINLHREELISLLRQISLFTSTERTSVRFTFTPGELHLSITGSDVGEGHVNMPINYQGDRMDVAFNPTFFLDILRHSKDETVQLNIKDAYNPGLVTDSSSSFFVLMPMRLDH
ncbi:MAG: DNA polymerase III subunit beta [Verrucomicrobia bacterium]|nr:DNA polymerase III subunit beta [Verrucomicrobiota bacterium]